jgi:hypothetical protein
MNLRGFQLTCAATECSPTSPNHRPRPMLLCSSRVPAVDKTRPGWSAVDAFASGAAYDPALRQTPPDQSRSEMILVTYKLTRTPSRAAGGGRRAAATAHGRSW